MSNMDSDLLNQLIDQQDSEQKHQEMGEEFSFYSLVRDGKVDELANAPNSLLDEGLGKLSDNPHRNILFHFIICTAMVTRLCIEEGMASEVAYTLSDLYIQKADKTKTIDEILVIHKEMVMDFAKRMKALQRKNHYSKHVVKAMDFVNNNLNLPINTTMVSEKLNLNKSYLCTLFKKETGETIGAYIERKKVERAKKYLVHTDIPYVDISNSLGFKSLSYFIQIFKKQTGMTVAEYRKKNSEKFLFENQDK